MKNDENMPDIIEQLEFEPDVDKNGWEDEKQENILPKEFFHQLSTVKFEENKDQKKKQSEIDMAITLVAISLMFVLCQSVKLIAEIYEQIACGHFNGFVGQEQFLTIEEQLDDRANCHHTTIFFDVSKSLGNLFVCINSAANFLLYMVRGKKFREAFYQTYFSCRQEEPCNFSRNDTRTSQIRMQTITTLLFYQIEPLKNGASLILPSSIARNS